MPQLKDSGERTVFDSGAQREIVEGKGRCDLLPLDIVGDIFDFHKHAVLEIDVIGSILEHIDWFVKTGDVNHIYQVIHTFCETNYEGSLATLFIEASIHYQDGANKYAENNWKQGIPLHSFIDSGVRHYLKWMRNDNDEPHDRAFVWNMLGLLWTFKYKPELNDLE